MNKLLRWFKRFQQHFYNHPGFILSREGVCKVPGAYSQTRLILGRGMCMYRQHDFNHIPGNKREQAMRNLLELWSPFDVTGHYCHWENGDAMVWLWDKASVDSDTLQQTHRLDEFAENIEIIPEALLLPRGTDGCVQQQCESGYELQSWANSVLIDSLWFVACPSSQERQNFCAQHGGGELIIADYPGAPGIETWQAQLSPLDWFKLNEKAIVVGLVVFCGVLLVWQEVRIAKAVYNENVAEQKLLEMEDELAPLLSARGKLRDLRVRNSALVGLAAVPSQAQLMALVSDLLPKDSALFREWHFQKGDLRFIIEDDNANTVEYVQALRSEVLFSDISAEQARGENRIQIKLTLAHP
ncbi:MAG: hypothetical protein KUG75_04565 [Pseudomonadales bacterium]|nr:hypothetical protein [Pseudomonadales bacterium]